MRHERERATDAGMQNQPNRAPPHWLNPITTELIGAEIPQSGDIGPYD
jgi:hypothetical protein